MTRLTKTVKKQILDAIIADSKYAVKNDPMITKVQEFLVIYHKDNQASFQRAMDLHKEAYDTIPETYRNPRPLWGLVKGEGEQKSYQNYASVQYTAAGGTFKTSYSVQVPEGVVLPSLTDVSHDPIFNAKIREFLEESREFHGKRNTYISKVSTLLDSVTTVKKLVTEYPRFEKYLPEGLFTTAPSSPTDVKEILKGLN